MSVAALKAELAAMPALEMTIRTRYLNVESRLQQEQQMNTLAYANAVVVVALLIYWF